MSEPPNPKSKWYLTEPRRFEFEARVIERLRTPDGTHAVVLDRTCFYPTSGGQPNDRGTLNSVAVFDVTEDEAGRVVHHLEAPLADPSVRGIIDAARRIDHMQQHSGQHLLSATCVRLFDRDTESFHLGAETCSIDLPGEAFDAAQRSELEREANRVVWEARSVQRRILGADECQRLRKPPPGHLTSVRVIEIDGWDMSPCCGTHVERTSEIGCIKVLSQERVRNSTRLHFVCGSRVLRHFQRALERQDEVVRRLTCHADEIPARVEQIAAEARRLRKQATALRAELVTLHARDWLAEAPEVLQRPLIVRILEDSATLGPAADALVEHGAIALLGVAGERAQLLFAGPEDPRLDLRPALRAACAEIGGRGGGPPLRVQGAGPNVAALPAALEKASSVLRGSDV